jgi:hypothetical protein
MKKELTVVGLILATLSVSNMAYADDVQVQDKSNYNLFNPTPDDQMRTFSPDRPGQGLSPYTVDAGHFQYESDIVNWMHTGHDNSFVIADPTFKYGVTNRVDLEVSAAPFNYSNTASGFGDIYTKAKINLLGNDGGSYALGIVPYVKIPTAVTGVGDGNWTYGASVPLEITLPQDWFLSFTSELDMLKNTDNNSYHPNYQNSAGFGHPIFSDNLTGYLGVWSDVNTDTGAQNQYMGETSLAWTIGNNLQLDAGVNVGLNKASTAVQPYIGISQRF